MKRRSRGFLALVLAVVALGLAVASTPKLRWRARLVVMKTSGQLVDMPWPDVLAAMRPDGGPYRVPVLLRTGNPHRAIRDALAGSADVAEGARLFRAECAGCHGVDGTGGSGRDLTSGVFRRGSSDLALYRTIARGVPGTAMPGFDLPDSSLWGLVAYVRTLRSATEGPSGTRVGDGAGAPAVEPRVTPERLLGAVDEPANWLTYSGSYVGWRLALEEGP